MYLTERLTPCSDCWTTFFWLIPVNVSFMFSLTVLCVLSSEPPVPASYYWYFLSIIKNQIVGSPPFVINGKATLLNMGFRLFNTTWLSTTISTQDCLLNPDICQTGFAIGIKIRLDLSVKFCKTPRYILDTGPGAKAQGVSLYVEGGILVAQVTSSRGTWQVKRFKLKRKMS